MLNNDERERVLFRRLQTLFVSRNCLAEISVCTASGKKWCAKQNVISHCSSNFGFRPIGGSSAASANKKLLYGRRSVVNHFAIKSQKSKEMHEICPLPGFFCVRTPRQVKLQQQVQTRKAGGPNETLWRARSNPAGRLRCD